jgi:hypothetical protein
MRRILSLTAAACLISPAAFAHAFLGRASLAVGSAVSGSPPALNLTYTEPVEPRFSTVHVTNAPAPPWTMVNPRRWMTAAFCRLSSAAAAGCLRGGVACHFSRHAQDRRAFHVHREPLNDQPRQDHGDGPRPAPGGDSIVTGDGRLHRLDAASRAGGIRQVAKPADQAVVGQRADRSAGGGRWLTIRSATIAAETLSDALDALPVVGLHTRYGNTMLARGALVLVATIPALPARRGRRHDT